MASIFDAVVVGLCTLLAARFASDATRQQEFSSWRDFLHDSGNAWALLFGITGTAYTAIKRPLWIYAHERDREPSTEVVLMAHEGLVRYCGQHRRRVFDGLGSLERAGISGEAVSETFQTLCNPDECIRNLLQLLHATTTQELSKLTRKRLKLRVDLVRVDGDKITSYICSVPDDEPALGAEKLSDPHSGFMKCLRELKPQVWPEVLEAVTRQELVQSSAFSEAQGGSLLCVPLIPKMGQPPVAALSVFAPKDNLISKKTQDRLVWLTESVKHEIIAQILLKHRPV